MDVEVLLQLNDQCPLVLIYLISEMLLQQIDGLSGDNGDQPIFSIEVLAHCNSRISSQLDSHTAGRLPRFFDLLMVRLDGLNDPNPRLFFSLDKIIIYIFAVDADGRTNLQNSLLYIHSQNNRVVLSESSDLLEDAWEYGVFTFLLLALFLDLLHKFVEVVGQVVDDVGRKNTDVVLLGVFLGIRQNLHIKHQQTAILFLSAFGVLHQQGLHGFEHIVFGYWPNRHIRHWNLLFVKVV